MAWQGIPIDYVSVDADRWRQLDNYYRQNIDEWALRLRCFEAGELSFSNLPTNTYYDVNADTGNVGTVNIQLYEVEGFVIPEGITVVQVAVQCLGSVSSALLYLEVQLFQFSTGALSVGNIINLPVGAPAHLTVNIAVAGGEQYRMVINSWNNTGSNQQIQFRELYVSPIP